MADPRGAALSAELANALAAISDLRQRLIDAGLSNPREISEWRADAEAAERAPVPADQRPVAVVATLPAAWKPCHRCGESVEVPDFGPDTLLVPMCGPCRGSPCNCELSYCPTCNARKETPLCLSLRRQPHQEQGVSEMRMAGMYEETPEGHVRVKVFMRAEGSVELIMTRDEYDSKFPEDDEPEWDIADEVREAGGDDLLNDLEWTVEDVCETKPRKPPEPSRG